MLMQYFPLFPHKNEFRRRRSHCHLFFSYCLFFVTRLKSGLLGPRILVQFLVWEELIGPRLCLPKFIPRFLTRLNSGLLGPIAILSNCFLFLVPPESNQRSIFCGFLIQVHMYIIYTIYYILYIYTNVFWQYVFF